ncbi:hypothetical protein Thermo_00352 [Thermoplasmatales archaeon]|nr:hypothetical protein Thermo_00352 [Thermoplasmatales archaeon]
MCRTQIVLSLLMKNAKTKVKNRNYGSVVATATLYSLDLGLVFSSALPANILLHFQMGHLHDFAITGRI